MRPISLKCSTAGRIVNQRCAAQTGKPAPNGSVYWISPRPYGSKVVSHAPNSSANFCASGNGNFLMKKSPLLVIFFVVFFDLLAFGIVIPILPYYSKTFGASAFELGWLMAVYSIMQFLFAPFWGGLSDRIGRRPVLLFTILGGASCMVATALAGDYWILFAARLLAGIFGANISTATAYIADVTSEENRAKGMGIIGAGFGLGFIFGPALGGILSVHGYATPILIAAGLGLANFLFAFFVLEESREANSKPAGRKFSAAGLRLAFARNSTAIPIGLFFLSTLAFTQLEVIFGLYVLGKFGYGAQQAGYLLAGMGVVSAILQGGLIGRLAKKYGEKKLLPVGFFFMAVSLLGAPFSPTVALFGLFLFGIAIGNGLVNPSLSSLVSKGAPADKRGSVLGIFQSGSSLARVVGPPLAGLLFDRVGPASPMFLSCGLMFVAALGALSSRRRLA
ncbi:MAG: MFS transporter [Proteobacteria bacterium]|nr:MAG: MFS transporter [Pseudomonadota bacterium]